MSESGQKFEDLPRKIPENVYVFCSEIKLTLVPVLSNLGFELLPRALWVSHQAFDGPNAGAVVQMLWCELVFKNFRACYRASHGFARKFLKMSSHHNVWTTAPAFGGPIERWGLRVRPTELQEARSAGCSSVC